MAIITFPDSPYRLHQPFEPAGDQPTAIAQLVEGIEDGLSFQTLLGVTGSGKTIKVELAERIAFYQRESKLIEAQRIKQRTRHELEMLNEIGFCKGIENCPENFSAIIITPCVIH